MIMAKWTNEDWTKFGAESTGTIFDIASAQMGYRAKIADINMQKETTLQALEDRVAARNQMLTNQITAMKASQAARGVEGAEGIYTGAEKAAEADKRAMRINTANTMRQLEYSRQASKAQRDMQIISGFIKMGTSAATMGM